MRIALTGATGFVGRNFLLAALESPTISQIVTPVRNEAKLRAQLAAEGMKSLPANLTLLPWSELGKVAGVDAIVHAAGVLFGRTREDFEPVNVGETIRLIDSLQGNERLLILSSQSAGGPAPAGSDARRISQPDEPLTLYGESKLAMEKAVRERRPDAMIWRPPMILGARDTATLPLFKLAAGPVQLKPGLSPKSFSWIDAGDLTAAMLRSLTSGTGRDLDGRTIYSAAPSTFTDEELIALASDLAGRKPRMLRLPLPAVQVLSEIVDSVPALRAAVPSLTRDRARELRPDRWVVDAGEFLDRFGQLVTTDLRTSLASALAWYRQNGFL